MSGGWQKPLPKRFQFDGDLSTEPETDKALRMLRGLRHWLNLKRRNTMVFEVDGEQIILIHVRQARDRGALSEGADTAPDVEL